MCLSNVVHACFIRVLFSNVIVCIYIICYKMHDAGKVILPKVQMSCYTSIAGISASMLLFVH